MKYLYISICIVFALCACGSEGDYPVEGMNHVQEQVDQATEEVRQETEDAGLKLRAFLTQAAEVIEGAAAGARTKLEEQDQE